MCPKFVLFVQIILAILSLTTTNPVNYNGNVGEANTPKIKRENSLVYDYHYEEKPEEEPKVGLNQSKITVKNEKPLVTYKFSIDAKPKNNYQEYFTSYKTDEHSQKIQHKESYDQENKYEHHNYVKYHQENKNEKHQSVRSTVSTLGALNGVVDQEVLDLTSDIVKAIEHNIEKSESQTGESIDFPNSNQKVKVKLWYAGGNEEEDKEE